MTKRGYVRTSSGETKQNDAFTLPVNPKEVVLHYSPSDDNRIAAFSMAENLKSAFRFYTPAGDTSDIWVYDVKRGIWIARGKEWISEIVTRSMAEFYRTPILNEVLQKIRNETKDDTVDLGKMAPTKIVMGNGVFDMRTCTFSPDFNPDDYQLIALLYDYDANATCPRFKQFLDEVCPNEDERMALVEFMGYCLVHHHKFHLFVILVGVGDNGKTTFLNTLIAMLGEKNVSGITLQQLAHDKFMPAQLVGKLANICADISDRPVRETGTVKALTGGDLIQIQHKHKDSYPSKNITKLIFSANQIPIVKDLTDAWYRRVRIIDFPNKFELGNEKRDPNLGDKLAAEVQAVFNLAVEGWKRMVQQKGLTGTKSAEDNRQDIIKRTNPLQYFAYRFCSSDPDCCITAAATYHAYRKVSIKLGKVPLTKNYFGTRLLEMLDYTESRQKKIKGKNTRIYDGLKVNLELLAEELGNKEHDISIYQGGENENIVMIYSSGVSVVTDPEQKELTSPDGGPAGPQPPLPDKALFKIWSSRELDYGLSIDATTLDEREQDVIGNGVKLGYAENDTKGEFGANTYCLTSKGLNAMEEVAK